MPSVAFIRLRLTPVLKETILSSYRCCGEISNKMKAISALVLLAVCVPICCGKHFIPRMPMRDHKLSDEGCEDLPKWKDRCPKWAETGECEDPGKKVFMEHYCRKSCKLPCKTEPSPVRATKPPAPPAFCHDRDKNCPMWKSLGLCEYPGQKLQMAVYCGVTCDYCKAPTPDECYDKGDNCEDLKMAGFCSSTDPKIEYEVKTKCLETCEFCVPDVSP